VKRCLFVLPCANVACEVVKHGKAAEADSISLHDFAPIIWALNSNILTTKFSQLENLQQGTARVFLACLIGGRALVHICQARKSRALVSTFINPVSSLNYFAHSIVAPFHPV